MMIGPSLQSASRKQLQKCCLKCNTWNTFTPTSFWLNQRSSYSALSNRPRRPSNSKTPNTGTEQCVAGKTGSKVGERVSKDEPEIKDKTKERTKKASTGRRKDSLVLAEPVNSEASRHGTLQPETFEALSESSIPHHVQSQSIGRGRQSRRIRSGMTQRSITERHEHEWYKSIPSVPNTTAISDADFKLSTFFALHRPLSLDSPIPQMTEQQSFDKIFELPTPKDKLENALGTSEVMSTISRTIKSLQNRSSESSNLLGLQWQNLDESDNHDETSGAFVVKHGTISNEDDAAARMQPYAKPPPPRSPSRLEREQTFEEALFEDLSTRNTSSVRSQAKRLSKRSEQEKPRAFRAEVVVYVDGDNSNKQYVGKVKSLTPLADDMHSPSGPTLFIPESSPFSPTSSVSKPLSKMTAAHQKLEGKGQKMPFGIRLKIARVLRSFRPNNPSQSSFENKTANQDVRMSRRGELVSDFFTPSSSSSSVVVVGDRSRQMVDNDNDEMVNIDGSRNKQIGYWAISVRRQRKLKMKKHKLKKLRKRTRTLRRKLDK